MIRCEGIAILAVLSFGLAGSASGADAAPSDSLQVEACALVLTAAGTSARFSDIALFSLNTADDGSVSSVKVAKDARTGSTFLSMAEVHQCLGRWRLGRNREYTVMLQYGTTGALLTHWVLQVSSNSHEVLRVLLPRR